MGWRRRRRKKRKEGCGRGEGLLKEEVRGEHFPARGPHSGAIHGRGAKGASPTNPVVMVVTCGGATNVGTSVCGQCTTKEKEKVPNFLPRKGGGEGEGRNHNYHS